jgi:tRNA dimethylallyltransferase
MGPPLLAIVGPTASGKSDLALALAGRLPLDILVADSRQVYRGMDVGTTKPDAAARTAVPHHLLDLVDPDAAFTVADWVSRARRLLPEIARRGRLPLVVAGTGLYLNALVDGHDYRHQAFSPETRERLTAELEAEGLPALARRLAGMDAAAAKRIDLRNPRRVLRALERAEAGGGAASVSADPYPGRLALIGISRPREVLYRRIDERAARLFASGLLEETRRLLDAGHAPDLPALSGHGYREAAAHLAGEWSLEEAIAATARRTRQYAKRQLTWFRRDPRIVWIQAGERAGDDPQLVTDADQMLRAALS